MAKSGKHLAPKEPKKKIGLHLKPAESDQNNTELEPLENAEEATEAENTAEKKLNFDSIKARFIKGLKRLLNHKKKPKKVKKKLTRNEAIIRGAEIFAVLLFCFLMITPLRGCVMGNNGYISEKAAEKTAIADSGVKSGDVESMFIDMIKLEGDTCYKIEFTSGVNGYKYIVNAETGDIVAQGFYTVNDTETED